MNQYKQLQANLTKLNLTNMAGNLEQYISQVNNHKLSFSEALLKLCQHRFKIVRNHRFKNVLFHRFKCCFACCSV